jgi:hypothetical protein
LCKTEDSCDFAFENSALGSIQGLLGSRQVFSGLSYCFSQVFVFQALINKIADGCKNQLGPRSRDPYAAFPHRCGDRIQDDFLLVVQVDVPSAALPHKFSIWPYMAINQASLRLLQ